MASASETPPPELPDEGQLRYTINRLSIGGQYFVANDTFDSGYAMLRLGLSMGL